MAKQTGPPMPPSPPNVRTDTVNQQVPGGFANDDVRNNEQQSEQPTTKQHPIAPAVNDINPGEQLAGMLGAEGLARLIQSGVESYLKQNGIESPKQSFVEASARGAASVEPDFPFLKHYRNDASPELVIQELNMSADRPQLEPLSGSVIRFRRGHFYAMNENQVKQIDWMTNTPTHSGDGATAMGGHRGIYEDDGEKLYYCQMGCSADEFVSASETKYEAHLRAVHNVG